MKNFFQLVVLIVAAAGVAAAGDAPRVPEIGPGTAATALAVLAGGLLVMRARRKR